MSFIFALLEIVVLCALLSVVVVAAFFLSCELSSRLETRRKR